MDPQDRLTTGTIGAIDHHLAIEAAWGAEVRDPAHPGGWWQPGR